MNIRVFNGSIDDINFPLWIKFLKLNKIIDIHMLQKLKFVLILTHTKTPNTYLFFLNKFRFDRDTLTKTFFFSAKAF